MDAPTTDFHALKSPRVVNEDAQTIPTHPLDAANPISLVFFAWANKLLAVGNKRQLDPEDMWPLQDGNKVAPITALYSRTYNEKKQNLLSAFFSLYGVQLIGIAIMQLFTAGCDLYGPAYVLRKVVEAVEKPTFDDSYASLLVLSLYGIQLAGAFVKAHMNFLNNIISMQLSASIRSMLFEKSLQLNGKSKKIKTAGDIANLFSLDVSNIMQFTNLIWIVPLQVAVVLVLIHELVGWAIFMGLAVVLVILVINAGVANAVGKSQLGLFQAKDASMQVINEVFGAIQIVKFNAWEE
ncbi:unnamed protein product, partial [Aphanomyces euteiches]